MARVSGVPLAKKNRLFKSTVRITRIIVSNLPRVLLFVT